MQAAQCGDECAAHAQHMVRLGSRMLDGAAKILIGAFFEALARKARSGSDASVKTPSPQSAASLWQRLLRLLGMRA